MILSAGLILAGILGYDDPVNALSISVWVLAAISTITTVQRILHVRKALLEPVRPRAPRPTTCNPASAPVCFPRNDREEGNLCEHQRQGGDEPPPRTARPATSATRSASRSSASATARTASCRASSTTRTPSAKEPVPGLMHVDLGGYHVSDIEFTCAFDINATKVGKDLGQAIWAKPNNTIKFATVPKKLGAPVHRGMTLDGIGKYAKEVITKAPGETADIVSILKATHTDVVVSYLPGRLRGRDPLVRRADPRGRLRFVNCIPVFIASEDYWDKKFKKAGVPIIGDDIKSQVGATIVHRTLARLFHDRGVKMLRTSQLNVGGNMDFYNMLERERLESKKISKTQAVTSIMGHELPKDDVYIGPSDYVPWLTDRKWAHIRVEGQAFGDVPLNLEMKLEVWDSPNSAGIVIDAVRLCKLALNHGIGGQLDGPSSYLMKSPEEPAPGRRRAPGHGHVHRQVRRQGRPEEPAQGPHGAAQGRGEEARRQEGREGLAPRTRLPTARLGGPSSFEATYPRPCARPLLHRPGHALRVGAPARGQHPRPRGQRRAGRARAPRADRRAVVLAASSCATGRRLVRDDGDGAARAGRRRAAAARGRRGGRPAAAGTPPLRRAADGRHAHARRPLRADAARPRPRARAVRAEHRERRAARQPRAERRLVPRARPSASSPRRSRARSSQLVFGRLDARTASYPSTAEIMARHFPATYRPLPPGAPALERAARARGRAAAHRLRRGGGAPGAAPAAARAAARRAPSARGSSSS